MGSLVSLCALWHANNSPYPMAVSESLEPMMSPYTAKGTLQRWLGSWGRSWFWMIQMALIRGNRNVTVRDDTMEAEVGMRPTSQWMQATSRSQKWQGKGFSPPAPSSTQPWRSIYVYTIVLYIDEYRKCIINSKWESPVLQFNWSHFFFLGTHKILEHLKIRLHFRFNEI
jgi:hypothetical protein